MSWTFDPGVGAPPEGLWYRVSIDGEEFSPWSQVTSDPDSIWYVGMELAEWTFDDGYRHLLSKILTIDLGVGECTSETTPCDLDSLPGVAILDVVFNGQSAFTVQGDLEWAEPDCDFDRSVYAGPRWHTADPEVVMSLTDYVMEYRFVVPTPQD